MTSRVLKKRLESATIRTVRNVRLITRRACEFFKFNGGPPQDVALALADAVRNLAWVETHATKTHKLGAMMATLVQAGASRGISALSRLRVIVMTACSQ